MKQARFVSDRRGFERSPRRRLGAAMRADEFSEQGNIGGQRVWTRIMQAIEEFQRERPGDGEATL